MTEPHQVDLRALNGGLAHGLRGACHGPGGRDLLTPDTPPAQVLGRHAQEHELLDRVGPLRAVAVLCLVIDHQLAGDPLGLVIDPHHPHRHALQVQGQGRVQAAVTVQDHQASQGHVDVDVLDHAVSADRLQEALARPQAPAHVLPGLQVLGVDQVAGPLHNMVQRMGGLLAGQDPGAPLHHGRRGRRRRGQTHVSAGLRQAGDPVDSRAVRGRGALHAHPAGRLQPVQHPAQGPTIQPGALSQHRLGDLHRRLPTGRIKQREHHQAGLLVIDADHRPLHCRSHEKSPS